ncbi:MAG: hypothetical protein A2X29_06340 [Elusimicrobia bacterium GWA2_64_40]|nr:MAG: hypothetical protein A2X29_06340 [Elusimicrobia bacterium GWA2_64_40]
MKTYVACYNDSSEMTIEGERFLRPGFLDSFLGYLKDRNLDVKVFARHLERLLVELSGSGIDPSAVDAYFLDCSNLNEYQTLARGVILKRLSLAGLSRCPAPTEKIRLSAKQYLRGVFVVNYFIAKALGDMMPKAEAIALFEDFTDLQTKTKYNLPHLEKVADLLAAKSPPGEVFAGGHDFVEFELNEGQAGCKVMKCKWHEVLKEFNDPDLEYAVICHYDFEAARCHNPNFKLTREGTLAQGRPYCDFIWHDTRVKKSLNHPAKDFWDNLTAK